MLGSSMIIERSVGHERNCEQTDYQKRPFIPFSEFKNDTMEYMRTNMDNLSRYPVHHGSVRDDDFDMIKTFLDDFYRQTPQIKSMYIENIVDRPNTPNGRVSRIFVFLHTPEQIADKYKNNMPVYGMCLSIIYGFDAGSKKYDELKRFGFDRVIPITSKTIKLIEDLHLQCVSFTKDLRDTPTSIVVTFD